MKLFYPLTVVFADKRVIGNGRGGGGINGSTVGTTNFSRSVVRLKGLSAFELHDCDSFDRVVLLDSTVELEWPHHLYVLVNTHNESSNLAELRSLLVNAAHAYRASRRRKAASVASGGGGGGARGTDTNNPIDGSMDHLEPEAVLYDVGSPLTSLFDLIGDTPTSATHRKSLVRANNLYRIRVRTGAELRHLHDWLVENSHYWTDKFSLPVHQRADHFRFALDIYVANLRFKLARDDLQRLGKLDDQAAGALGHGAADKCRDLLLKHTRLRRNRASAHALRHDPIDLKRWFECGRWCLVDEPKRFFAVAGWKEFYGAARQRLTRVVQRIGHVAFLRAVYDCPLDFVPRVTWRIARGNDEKRRGVTGSQPLYTVTLTCERPSLDSAATRVAIVRALVPRGMTVPETERIIVEQTEGRYRTANGNNDPPEDEIARVIPYAYTDERALLLDLVTDLTTNHTLAHHYFGLYATELAVVGPRLSNVLLGYDSMEYDFVFLLNRCLYHGHLPPFRQAAAVLRDHANTSRPLCYAFTFNESQLHLDARQFLMSRNRQLASYYIVSVMKAYGCYRDQTSISALELRRLYGFGGAGCGGGTANGSSSAVTRTHFARVVRSNFVECLCLSRLYDRMSFQQHMSVMMRYFFSPLDVVAYKGNSSLLPCVLQLDSIETKRTLAVVRQPQFNRFVVDVRDLRTYGGRVFAENVRILRRRCGVVVRMENTPSHERLAASSNPFVPLLNRMRALSATVMAARKPIGLSSYDEDEEEEDEEDDDDYFEDHDAAAAGLLGGNRRASNGSTCGNVLRRLTVDELADGRVTLPATNEMELLRVGEKSYIGGMNYAEAGHARFPVLMDYNSFYPSIIRSYALDVNKVALLDLRQLLLTVPIALLDQMLARRVLRLFDYTAPEDLSRNVDLQRHSELFGGDEWYEAVEYRTIDSAILTSRHLGRGFLALLTYEHPPSTISAVVTKALDRRAVWKRKKKENPTDQVVVFMEMMEKLLANSLYGYLNFQLSAVFSRTAAAAVTLLCRNTFCRTRRIIESRELIATTLLDPDRYRFRVVYIDTDGCIFVLDDRFASTTSTAAAPCGTTAVEEKSPFTPPYRLYADLEPDDTVAVYDRLTDTVNRMLDLRHVRLAAEHQNAVAVCVLARKKYALLLRPTGDVKKTGFEKNASPPIRAMYDSLLRHSQRAFHLYRLVPTSGRFVATIRSHRLFFFAVFDRLYAFWRETRRGSDDAAYALTDFGLNRPLNPKQTGGEMSRFIDRVLHDYGYAAGDRVWILRVIRKRDCVYPDRNTLVPAGGSLITIAELDATNNNNDNNQVDEIVPNFKFFLGCYTRYFYQCLEGQQTLRDSPKNTREPIEPGYHLDSFNSIVQYCWAAWFYTRIVADRWPEIRGVYWPSNGMAVPRARMNTLRKMSEQPKVSTTTTTTTVGGTRPLPKWLPTRFFDADPSFRSPASDNPFYSALFDADQSSRDETADRAIKANLLQHLSIQPL